MHTKLRIALLAVAIPLLFTGVVAAQTGGGVGGLIDIVESLIAILQSVLEFLRNLGSAPSV